MIAVADGPMRDRIRKRRRRVTLYNMSPAQLVASICPTCNVFGQHARTYESGASRVQYRYCPKCGQSLKISIGQ